jgi:hypothetical protein
MLRHSSQDAGNAAISEYVRRKDVNMFVRTISDVSRGREYYRGEQFGRDVE